MTITLQTVQQKETANGLAYGRSIGKGEMVGQEPTGRLATDGARQTLSGARSSSKE